MNSTEPTTPRNPGKKTEGNPSFRSVAPLFCCIINLLVVSGAWGLYTPPSNPFIAPGETPVTLDITSGTIADVQTQIDAARSVNPGDFILINLSGTYTVSTSPLVLTTKQILYLNGTIEAGAGVTATSLVSVPSGQSFVGIMGVGGSILDGKSQDLHAVEVLASGRIVINNLSVQDTGRDGLSVQGLGNSVWDAQISISSCFVTGSGDAGIRLYNANQCALIDNVCENNSTAGIEVSADTTALGNNTCNLNATGISVSGENNSLYGNTCDGNSDGVSLTSGSSVTSVVANTISNNTVSGIKVNGSNNTLFDNSYTGNTVNVNPVVASNNNIVGSALALDGTGNDYFYPPTARNPHVSTVIVNGKGRTNLTINSTTIDSVQTQYDAAVAANPGNVIVLTLDGTFTLGANPLNLSSYTCVLLATGAIIQSNASTTAAYAIVATGESYISVSGGTLDGDLQSVGGIEFTTCTMTVIDGVTVLNSGEKTVRGPADMIHLDGGGAPKIVRGCTVDYGEARGIWTQASGNIITDNTVTNCNMDGIDLDSFSGKSLVANNSCTDNIRYGIFVEEGANRNIVIDNKLDRNSMAVNVFSFAAGPTQYNSIIANSADGNERGLRDGDNTGLETKHNYFFNNVVLNSTQFGIASQTANNYYSETALSNNAANTWTVDTVFFNPFTAPTTPPVVLFATDFESDTIGAEPAGFALLGDTGFAGNSLNVIAAESVFADGPGSASTGGPGSKALQWLDINTTDSNPDIVVFDLATGSAQDLIIRFDFVNIAGNGLRFQLEDDAGTRAIRLDLDNGGRILNNGTGATLEFTGEGLTRWHAIEITTNLANNTYTLFMERDGRDATLTFPNLPFANPVTNIGLMEFVDFSGASNTAEYYIDNISIEVAVVSAYTSWAQSKGLTLGVNDGATDDPDGDSLLNIDEFALDGDPLSGSRSGKVNHQVATIGADDVLTLTIPVRDGAIFSGTTELVSAPVDGVIYRVSGSNNLVNWTLGVGEVTGADATALQSGLPALSSGWTYRSFRVLNGLGTETRQFLRVEIEPQP